ncbi:MAG: hypothetical protein GX548_11930 [Lentisphaerae bacterium]|nr:hypothetical protein [Lentisphaerota bacterium]
MKSPFLLPLTSGLGLLALAVWLVPVPRLHPRPDLPEMEPFVPGETVVLRLSDPESFPDPESLGLVQRARAAGAGVRILRPGESMDSASVRAYQPAPGPESPAGYHPDQWPSLSYGSSIDRESARLLVLTAEETAVRNAAVIAKARQVRESGTDDGKGTRELRILSRARRGEIYLPGPVRAEKSRTPVPP